MEKRSLFCHFRKNDSTKTIDLQMEEQIEKGVLTIGRPSINPINPSHKDFTIAFIIYSRTFSPPLHAKRSYFPIFGLIAYNLRFCHS